MLLEEKDKRLEEKDKHNAALTKDKKILAITVVSLIASFIIFLIFDLCVSSIGWIQ